MRCFWLVQGAISLLCLSASADSAGCQEWMRSIADYDAAVDRVLQGEPESLMHELGRVMYESDAAKLSAIAKDAGARVKALDGIVAPRSVQPLHQSLRAHYGDIDTIASKLSRSLPQTPSLVEMLPAYRSLLGFYQAMSKAFAQHGCANGDVEAVNTRYLPELRETIAALEKMQKEQKR